MRSRAFLRDECGAVTTDWIVLSAGIVILGMVVAFAVMEDSGGYLMDEFETLNEKYARDGVAVTELRNQNSFDQ
jgi:hypothetical protein